MTGPCLAARVLGLGPGTAPILRRLFRGSWHALLFAPLMRMYRNSTFVIDRKPVWSHDARSEYLLVYLWTKSGACGSNSEDWTRHEPITQPTKSMAKKRTLTADRALFHDEEFDFTKLPDYDNDFVTEEDFEAFAKALSAPEPLLGGQA